MGKTKYVTIIQNIGGFIRKDALVSKKNWLYQCLDISKISWRLQKLYPITQFKVNLK